MHTNNNASKCSHYGVIAKTVNFFKVLTLITKVKIIDDLAIILWPNLPC